MSNVSLYYFSPALALPIQEESPESDPPSPKASVPVGVQLPPRGNLNMVNPNTVPQARAPKFSRGHHVPRPPLVVRHSDRFMANEKQIKGVFFVSREIYIVMVCYL